MFTVCYEITFIRSLIFQYLFLTRTAHTLDLQDLQNAMKKKGEKNIFLPFSQTEHEIVTPLILETKPLLVLA